MGIKSKQIDSLEASKVVQSDSRMFISKTELSRIAKLKTNVLMYSGKDDFPTTGETDVLYVAKKDIYQNGQPTIYIYNDKKYNLLSGGSTSSNGIVTAPYIRGIVPSDWVLENGEYKIEIDKSVHGQSNDSVLFAFVIVDGEYVHVPYKIENGKVTFISSEELECEILITDLNKGAKWDEIVDKPTVVKDISVVNGKLSLLMDNGVSKELSLSDIGLNDNRVGNLADLSTVSKTNIVSAINECFQNASNGKENIATAISGKGVDASSNDTFSELAEKIKKINSGGSNGDINYEDGATISAVYNDDFKANDVAFLKLSDKITYANELGGTVHYSSNCIAVTEDKEYRVIGHNEAPYISVYKKENDEYKILKDVIQLDSNVVDCAFSEDGNYLAVGYNKHPYVSVFRRNGDTFDNLQVEQPITSLSRVVYCIDISKDGTYVGFGTNNNIGYFHVLKRDGDVYNKLSNYKANGVSGIAGYCNGIKFCEKQNDNFVLIGTGIAPYFHVFDIDKNTDTYTKRELNCSMPTTTVSSCNVSSSGKYILLNNNIYINENGVLRDVNICNFGLSDNKGIIMNEDETKILVLTNEYPYAMLCDVVDEEIHYDKKIVNSFDTVITDAVWLDNDTFQCTNTIEPFLKEYSTSKQVDKLNVLKTNISNSIASRTCCISSDDKYYVWGLNSAPYINIYKKENETYTKIENIDILPTGTVQRVMFSNDTNYLYVSHTNSPYLTVYKRNGDIFTKLANPDNLVNGNANRMDLDNTDTFLAIGHTASPYLSIYKKNNDSLNMLNNPVDVIPTGAVVDVSFSKDSNYLACVTSGNTPLYVYKRDGDSFKTITGIEQFEKTTVFRVTFSDDGKYIAIASIGGLHIYVKDGETFIKMKVENTATNVYSAMFLPNGDVLCGTNTTTGYNLLFRIYDDLVRNLGQVDGFVTPSYTCYEIAFNPSFNTMIYSIQRGTYVHDIYHTNLKSLDCGYYLKDVINKTVTACEYSPCGNYFVMAYNSFPYLELYRVNGNEYVRLNSIEFNGSGRIWNIAFSKDGKYFTVAHEQAPFITMYEVVGEVFNKIDVFDIIPTGNARGVSFSRDDKYLAVSHEVAPYITIYEKETSGTFRKLANPSVLPTGIGYNCKFSKTDDYLAVTTHKSPYYILYDYSNGSFESMENLPNLSYDSYATSFDFSNNGEMFAIGQYRGYINVLELKNGKLRTLYKNSSVSGSSAYSVRNIRFSTDDKSLIYNNESAGGEVKEFIYSNKTWKPNKTSVLREKYGSCGIAIHPNGKHIASVLSGSRQNLTIYQRVNLQDGSPHIVSERHMDNYDKLCLIQENGEYGEEHNVKIIKDLYV